MEWITLVLIDKGYYDYDYQEPPEKEKERKLVTVEDTKKSNEEVKNILSAFGWGKKAQSEGDKDAQGKRPMSAGELQELVMKDINERAQARKK